MSSEVAIANVQWIWNLILMYGPGIAGFGVSLWSIRAANAAHKQARYAEAQAGSANRSAIAAEAQAAAAHDALAHLKEANEISAMQFWQQQLDSTEFALNSLSSVAEAFAEVQAVRRMHPPGPLANFLAARALETRGTLSISVASTSSDQVALKGKNLLQGIRSAVLAADVTNTPPEKQHECDAAVANLFARIDDLVAAIPQLQKRREAEILRAEAELARLEASRAARHSS